MKKLPYLDAKRTWKITSVSSLSAQFTLSEQLGAAMISPLPRKIPYGGWTGRVQIIVNYVCNKNNRYTPKFSNMTYYVHNALLISQKVEFTY